MKLKLILVAFAVLVATGCAPSLVVLHEGPDAVEVQHLKTDESYANWDRVEVWAMDGKFIGPTYVGATTKLAPGKHKLVVHMYFRRGIGPEYEAFIDLEAVLPASARLRLNGRVDGANAIVWLEDASTRTQVSGEARAPWRIIPRAQSVPIFIPAK